MAAPIRLVRRLHQVRQRLRVVDRVQAVHTLFVFEAVRLHRGHRLVPGPLPLRDEHRRRPGEGRLDHADHVERVVVGPGVQQLDRGEGERGERLIEGEVQLQVFGEHESPAARIGHLEPAHDPGVEQRPPDADGPPDELDLPAARLVRGLDELAQGRGRVRIARQHGQHHHVRDPQVRRQGLWFGGHQLVECLLGPTDLAVRGLAGRRLLPCGRLAAGLPWFPGLLGLGDRLRLGLGLLHGASGRENRDVAVGVVPGAARPAGDLVELARIENARAVAVVLGQGGQQHGADGHVDADTERVRPADHREKPSLREPFDEPPVAWKHPGVVHADPRPHQARQRPPETLGKSELSDHLRDPVTLLPAHQAQPDQALRLFHGGSLREMHDIHRRAVRLDEPAHRLRHVVQVVFEVQRHGALHTGDQRGLPAGPLREIVCHRGDVAQGAGHQHELRLRKFEQRHLPRPAALPVPVIVELVENGDAHLGVAPAT